MPKVLRIVNRLSVGGPTYNVSYLTKYLAPEYETILVSGTPEKTEIKSNFIYEKIGVDPLFFNSIRKSILVPWYDVIAYFQLRKLIKTFKPDIVHTHASKAGLLGRLVAYHCKVPVIIHTYHGTHFKGYFNKHLTNLIYNIEKYLCGISSAAIAISPQQYDELADTLLPKEKLYLVPLGFDLSRFSDNYAEKRAAFRNEFGLDEDTLAIGVVGRLVPIKNHALFFKGLKSVLENTTKKVRAFIVGDGELRAPLEALCKELGIGYTIQSDIVHDQPVVFTSWRTDIEKINAGVDIVALTSDNEGTPVSIIEALAASKPVVVSRVGGVEYIVADGETGLIFEAGDVNGFSSRLLNIIENDTLRHTMGAKASHDISRKFGVDRLVNDVALMYAELLQKAPQKKGSRV